MARLASSTHWAEATIVADGGRSRGCTAGDGMAGGEDGGAGVAAEPPGFSPTCGGLDEDDADGGCWTGVVAQPQLNRNGRTQSTTRTNAAYPSQCGMFPFPAITATLLWDDQLPET